MGDMEYGTIRSVHSLRSALFYIGPGVEEMDIAYPDALSDRSITDGSP
jgi:hypothetical protein